MSKAENEAKIAYQFWDISPNNYREYKGFVKGYQKATKDLVPLIHRLAESILFDWDNRVDVAKEVLKKLQEYKDE